MPRNVCAHRSYSQRAPALWQYRADAVQTGRIRRLKCLHGLTPVWLRRSLACTASSTRCTVNPVVTSAAVSMAALRYTPWPTSAIHNHLRSIPKRMLPCRSAARQDDSCAGRAHWLRPDTLYLPSAPRSIAASPPPHRCGHNSNPTTSVIAGTGRSSSCKIQLGAVIHESPKSNRRHLIKESKLYFIMDCSSLILSIVCLRHVTKPPHMTTYSHSSAEAWHIW